MLDKGLGQLAVLPPSLTQCWSFEIKLQNSGTLGGGVSHSSEFGQNCGYFQLVLSTLLGSMCDPQISLTVQNDQTSHSVWVWFTNFAKFAKIAFMVAP